jgi:transcriptional regulator with XRE-family HTH domain
MTGTKPVSKGPEFDRIGGLLRTARTAAGKTLRDVYEVTGIPINRIRWHELGDTMLRANELVDVANYLDISPADLIREPRKRPALKSP